jgi:hypothetical protein
MGVIRPELDTLDTTTAVGDSSPGVGAVRDESIIYTWPGFIQYVPEAVGTRIGTADGLTTIDGMLDCGMDSVMASILSNLRPELNPGQAAPPIPQVMACVMGMQRGIAKLELNDYIVLRSRGVAALRIDKTVGPIIQSGITTSLISGQKKIARRRMAYFIQDSIGQRLVQFSKMPLTDANKDNSVVEIDAFLDSLANTLNPAAQRIQSYLIDDKSGNTPESLAAEIFVIITKVKLIPSGDFLVLQTEVGNNVVTTAVTT